ncbi:hypothetical protein CANMA_001144 [Candida margitis]|uniref:uncharacterized protein n=1 Tax=Candida margitis TaxID=1775924 RepID=UPI0022263595|nr:uncharacterized protein CANMA_001144 [Candida margitis]KAI5969854.1 hypothetical protein CANMA_001144 [Candida margitis]
MTDAIAEFESKLSELTINNGLVISQLTQLAKQHPEVADQIIDLITARIYRVIPEQKLYTLYVLDDICKVVGNPYNILVGDDIYDIFIHIFQLNNDFVRGKLVKMYDLWKTVPLKNTGEPVYPEEQLNKIGQFLKKAGYPREQSVKSVDLPPKPTTSLQQSLINDIDKLIPFFENQLRTNSQDQKATDRFKALNSLKAMLTRQEMKAAELEAIKSHIVNIQSQATPVTPATTPRATTPFAPTNPAFQVFNNLILSGLVKKEQEPIQGSKPVYTLVFPETKYSLDQQQAEATLEDLLLQSSSIQRSEYDKLKFVELMSIAKRTSGGDLQHFINSNKLNSAALNLLYEAKPSKCSICGKRFTTDPEGANNKRLHLDWHFRMNKKLTVKGGNIQSRDWYIDDYEWVKLDENRVGEQESNSVTDQSIDIPTTTEIQYAIVPENDTNMNNRCLICREQVKAKYNDEIGEWVWYDCIKPPGEKNQRRIVHVACFNDKKRSADSDLNPNVKREKTY